MTKEELRAYAKESFLSRRYNCAEAVLKVMADYWGIKNDAIPRIATGLGGGVGATHQHVCGIVTGCAMAIGLALGRNSDDIPDRSAAQKVQGLLSFVQQRFGTVNCGDIIKVDFSAPDALQQKQRTRVEICGELLPDCCVWLAENVQPEQEIDCNN